MHGPVLRKLVFCNHWAMSVIQLQRKRDIVTNKGPLPSQFWNWVHPAQSLVNWRSLGLVSTLIIYRTRNAELFIFSSFEENRSTMLMQFLASFSKMSPPCHTLRYISLHPTTGAKLHCRTLCSNSLHCFFPIWLSRLSLGHTENQMSADLDQQVDAAGRWDKNTGFERMHWAYLSRSAKASVCWLFPR